MKHKLKSECAVFVYIETVSINSNSFPNSFLNYLSSLKIKANSIINKVTCNAGFICAIQIRGRSLCIRPISAHRFAEYPLKYINAVKFVDDDDKFFYVVTPSKTKRLFGNKCGSNDSYDLDSANSCHVFRTLPLKFTSHLKHAALATALHVQCLRDCVTGECLEFPSSCVGFVNTLHNRVEALMQAKSSCSAIDVNMVQNDDCTLNQLQTSVFLATCNKSCDLISDTNRKPFNNNSSVFDSSSSHLSNSSKRSRNSLGDSSSTHLLSRFLKAAGSLRSRVFESKMKPYPTSRNTHRGCNSVLDDDITLENSKEMDGPSNLSQFHSSNPVNWSKSFNNLLHDPIGYEHFMTFLKTEFSSENLEFWSVIRKWYEEYEIDAVNQKASEIYFTFLAPDAPQAVNVDEIARKTVLTYLPRPCLSMFIEAERQIYNLMKTDSYPRFLKSDVYWNLLQSNAIGQRSAFTNANWRLYKTPSNAHRSVVLEKIAENTPNLSYRQTVNTSHLKRHCTHSNYHSQSVIDTQTSPSHDNCSLAAPSLIGRSRLKTRTIFEGHSILSNNARPALHDLSNIVLVLLLNSMSTGYVSKRSEVAPPATGSFPIDRTGICKASYNDLVKCWKENNYYASCCSDQVITHLQCRMNNNMVNRKDLFPDTEQDWKKLGLGNHNLNTNKND